MNYLTTSVDIGLSAEETTALAKRVQQGLCSHLASEKEGAPFLFYLMGHDFQSISKKTNIPVDIIMLTAIYYNWPQKAGGVREIMSKEDSAEVVKSVQKDLANTILVVTKLAMEQQLADVVSGKIKPSQCRLIPNNIHSLQKLMEILDTLNAKPEVNNIGGSTQSINGQNIQINNYIQESEKSREKTKEEKEAMIAIVDS